MGRGSTYAPEIEWTRTYGGDAGDWGSSVQQTTDGGFIISGTTTSYGAGPKGYSDTWLLKTDATGNLEWTQTYGMNGSESGNVVQQTMDGGYLVVGYTSYYVPWIVKVTSIGELQWNRSYEGVYSIYPGGQQTTDGGYVIIGQKNNNFWLGKTDPHGNLEWNRTLPHSGVDTPRAVAQTTDGGYSSEEPTFPQTVMQMP